MRDSAGGLKEMEKNSKGIDSLQEEINIGDIRIADDVIRIVAGLAAQEIPGVIGMSGGLSHDLSTLLGKKEDPAKGVSVRFEGRVVDAAVYIVVEFGKYVPEIALAVQEKVKDSIESMTGYEVRFVDVHIQGVEKRAKSALELALNAELPMEEIVHEQVRRADIENIDNSFEAQLANLRDAETADGAAEGETARKETGEWV